MKVIAAIFFMTISGFVYQYFLAETPNYIHAAQQTYWAIATSLVFWSFGCFDSNH